MKEGFESTTGRHPTGSWGLRNMERLSGGTGIQGET